MTKSPLDDDIVADYVKKLEDENEELRKRPRRKFKSLSKYMDNAMDFTGEYFAFLFMGVLVLLVFGSLIMAIALKEPTGNYYLDFSKRKECYTVIHKMDHSGDEKVSKCFEESAQAHKQMKELRAIWQEQFKKE